MTTLYNNTMPLWEASEEMKRQSNMTRYMHWLECKKGLVFRTQEELWHWSVDCLEDFWASLWDFFQIQASTPYTTVLPQRTMPGAAWFPGAKLNYAEHVFRNASSSHPAIFFQSEIHPFVTITWDELSRKVSAVAHTLRALGVQRGERVVAYMPNIPETVVAFLACASIGAIWSSCPPEFGISSVIDRFKQIEPKVLFAVDGYRYNGKIFDRRTTVAELQQALPTLEKTITVPSLFPDDAASIKEKHTLIWEEVVSGTFELIFEQVPFDHPLWVLYSSGTTDVPKAIVQGHGGILLEHLKSLALHFDLKAGDRFFWFTTTGWMMWNMLIGGLLVGSTILLYDGSPISPHISALWKFAESTKMTLFGTSASYIAACMKAGIEPGKMHDLSSLRQIASTGSPLPPEGFQWVYEHVKRDVWLASISGGTDVCSAFLEGSLLLPVFAGELQCRALGASIAAFDEDGGSLINQVGELVISEPMPSMPLFFWNDPDNKRYKDSYFRVYPGVWRHGDWVAIISRGSAIIYGRSDATLNRNGVRMGSSEIYRVVESLPEILDSLVIGIELAGGKYSMPLFVVLQEDTVLDASLTTKIKTQIRNNVSPHHVPDTVIAISEVPRTLSGKKLEVPVKKLLMGIPTEKAISADAMSNPQSIQFFVAFATQVKK